MVQNPASLRQSPHTDKEKHEKDNKTFWHGVMLLLFFYQYPNEPIFVAILQAKRL
jgi:hypothetical protein